MNFIRVDVGKADEGVRVTITRDDIREQKDREGNPCTLSDEQCDWVLCAILDCLFFDMSGGFEDMVAEIVEDMWMDGWHQPLNSSYFMD